jgi:hypothetical protein
LPLKTRRIRAGGRFLNRYVGMGGGEHGAYPTLRMTGKYTSEAIFIGLAWDVLTESVLES